MKSALVMAMVMLAGRVMAENPYGLPDGMYSEVTTERGVVVAELFFKQVPLTVANHVGLAEGTLGPTPGKRFYDGLAWCRVVPGFVVQGGDPLGTGAGDAGYLFPDEIVPGLRHDGAGTLQMANDGPDTNGSQFCFMLSAQPRLNYQHTVFGKVVRGLDVLPKIQQGDTMRVRILRLGAEAAAFRADPETFAKLVATARAKHPYQGAREPGPQAAFDDPDHLLPAEWDRAKNFNFKLTNFERFTGVRLVARLFAKLPAAANGQLDAWLASEAQRLGVAERGALAVFLADTQQWHLRIGKNSIDTFLAGEPDRDLATATARLLATAKQQAEAATAESISRLGPGESLTPQRRTKILADCVLDPLIFRLEPR